VGLGEALRVAAGLAAHEKRDFPQFLFGVGRPAEGDGDDDRGMSGFLILRCGAKRSLGGRRMLCLLRGPPEAATSA
jgi:hypothetical protein